MNVSAALFGCGDNEEEIVSLGNGMTLIRWLFHGFHGCGRNDGDAIGTNELVGRG